MIISTSRGLYDLNQNKFILEGDGPYFGLSKDKNDFIYAVRRESKDVVVLDKEYNQVGKIDTPTCVDAHGLEIYNDKIYILSTKSNDIIQADLKSMEVEKIFKNSIGNQNPHMNSIKQVGDLLFVMSHRDNFTNSSCIHLFSPKINRAFRFFSNLGEHCHTIQYYNNTFWYCDSFNSRIASVDGDSINIESEGLVRGMALKDSKLYVGLSAKAPRAERHKDVDGEIFVFDFDSKEHIETIVIKDCGQVNEIILH
jgi:sugar lactone lactonase YvrE